MDPTRRRIVGAALAAALLLIGCGEAREERPGAGRILEPLPPPPALRIEEEPLPGSAGELAVVAARPQGESPPGARPTITFSKPVVALGSVADEAALEAPATVEPPIAGSWRWLGSASVELVPDAPIPFGTRYTVTVPAELAALDGARLSEPFTFHFETPRPKVMRLDPPAGSRWLGAEEGLRIRSNQRLEALEVHAHFEVEGEGRIGVRVAEEEEELVEEPRRPLLHHRWEPGVPEARRPAWRYHLIPTRPLPLDREVVLVIDADLRGSEGPLALGEEQRFTFRTHGPMRFSDARPCLWEEDPCPWGPLILSTSNLADVDSLRERIRLEPEVEIDWDLVEARFPFQWESREDPYVVIPGPFRPGTSYTVRIAAGARDVFEQEAEAVALEVRFDDRPPSFDVGNGLALLESRSEEVALPIQSVNLHELLVEIEELGPAQMASALFDRRTLGSRLRGRQIRLAVEGERNVGRWTPFDPRIAFPDGVGSGLFVASFRRPDEPAEHAHQVLGQVTDLAVHAKLGATSGVVWVTRLSDGSSVQGARLGLHDADGQVVWRGATDHEGLAKVPGLRTIYPTPDPARPWKSRFAVVAAEKDGEIGITASSWNAGLGPWAFGLTQDWSDGRPTSLGTVFTERGIYRPGDTVHLKGIARFLELGEVRTPAPGTRIELRIDDPRGEELLREELTTTAFGSFATEFELGREVPLGTHSVRASWRIGKEELLLFGSFRVEEYRPPQFRLDVSTDDGSAGVIAGEPMVGRVLARYLFGAAMSGASVRWTAVRTSASFTPPGNAGFDFGANTWWWDDGPPVPSREVIGGGEGTTGQMGELAIELGESAAPGEKVYDYVLEVEVADVDRQRAAGRASFRVHPAAYYAGLREVSSGFGRVGEPLRLELIAVDPGGRRVSGIPIELVVKRREWRSIRKKGVGGEWFTISEPVEEAVFRCEQRSAPQPVECSFEPQAPGLYVYEAALEDERGRRQITRSSGYVEGSGWVSWQRTDSDRIDLVADRPVYEPGETAKILVKSPYPEAEALLTVEREGVSLVRRLKLEGSAATLEVPVDEVMIPNAFVSVLLVRGRVAEGGLESGDDPGRPAIRLGYTELKVERSAKRLQVGLRPDAAEKRPGQKVRVEVEVRDHLGEGKQAEVTVWAVDEGVLRLTGYEVPDPVEAIHPPRGLGVRLGEPLIHLVQRRLYGDKGESRGGGGGDGSGGGFRSDFRTTVLFAPEVITDEAGKAEVELELPDNLTTYRIMAVAITRGDRMGSGTAELQVNQPLLALPALPRLARVGDVFEAGVVIHATGFERAEVEVAATAEGLAIEGETRIRRVVRRGSPEEVRFRFAARKAGEATLRFRVEGGGERDGLEQRLPVVLPVELEAVATYGETLDEAVEAVSPPAGIRPGIGGLEIVLASTILGGLEASMDQLVEYPYGCLEQQASRLVPFVAMRELSGRMGIAWEGGAAARGWIGEQALASRGSLDPDRVIAETIRAIEGMQNHDGGYRYWSSGSCSSHWASTYAVLALGRAREVGFPVDAEALARGQEFLAREVAVGACERCGWGCVEASDTERVFALYALARTGAPKPSHYGPLFERRRSLPLFAQAMLADAIFVGGGDREKARSLLQELLNFAMESPEEVHFEEAQPRRWAALWSSDTRTTALVLQTLATVSPEHPYVPKMSRYLQRVRGRDGRYRNTQEAAFALIALGEVSRRLEAEPPRFRARVDLGDRELVTTRFDERSARVERLEVPPSALGAGGELRFSKEGEGRLSYGARLRYAPLELPTDPLDRGIAVQRWFEPFQGGGQIRELLAGELVRVQVRVASPQERQNAVIEIPLPAGLEVVDTTLATAALPPPVEREGGGDRAEDGGGEEESPWATRFFSPFVHLERRDDRLTLFADRLPPGVHTTRFVARATTPGDFVLPPARAEEMYAPEVSGRSDGGRVRILDQGPVAER